MGNQKLASSIFVIRETGVIKNKSDNIDTLGIFVWGVWNLIFKNFIANVSVYKYDI